MNLHAILCPIDFSKSSEAALEHASHLAAESHAKLYLLHVIDESAAYCTEFTGMGYLADMSQRVEHESEHLLDQVEPTVPGVECEHVLLLGSPAPTIVKVADEHKIDLIVMGSHGRTGMARLLMGSVAEEVVRTAHCPVLTIKQPTPEKVKIESCDEEPSPGNDPVATPHWPDTPLATREGNIP